MFSKQSTSWKKNILSKKGQKCFNNCIWRAADPAGRGAAAATAAAAAVCFYMIIYNIYIYKYV